MIDRKDDIKKAKERITNDKIAFNDANLKGITLIVSSDNININDLADKIYNIYINMLRTIENENI